MEFAQGTEEAPAPPPPATAHALMLGSLTSYFQKHASQRRVLHDLVEGKTAISLRLMDWFVTHYAKKNNVLYWLDSAGTSHASPPAHATHDSMRKFTVYTEYRAQLRAFSKHAFDPFRRHNRISFVVDERPDGTPVFVDTTIGQLNFFRWALQNKVIDYVLRNLSQIEDEMASFQQHRRATPPSAPAAAAPTTAATPTTSAAPTSTTAMTTASHQSKTKANTKANTTGARPRVLPTRIQFD